MAENGEPFCQNVAAYIQTRLGIKAAYVNDFPWQERERLFDEGNIQILWLCGLPTFTKPTCEGATWNCSRWFRRTLGTRGGRMARFLAASDTDYDPIRNMARAAEQITLEAW